MIVLDASAAVELLLGSPAGAAVGTQLIAHRSAVTPVHFDAEVYGALRRIYLRGTMDRTRLRTATERLAQLDAERVEIVSLLAHAEALADVLGGHDVFYVLTAMSRACPLLTCDVSLGRAVERLGLRVVAIDPTRPG